jgi:RNA polymerase sigma factor (sigma-70 family)
MGRMMAGADDAVGFWLAAAGRQPLLTPAQEIQLGRQVREWFTYPGGPDQAPPGVQRRGRRARDRFVTANLRLVVTIAKKWFLTTPRENHADLLQVGADGLRIAVEKFDPEAGYKFSTYAYWWIRQAVGRYSDGQAGGNLRVPSAYASTLRQAGRAAARLGHELGRQPTTAEVAAAVGVTPERLAGMAEALQPRVSLDAPVGEDGTTCLGEHLPAPYHGDPDAERIRDALAQLDPQARRLLEYHYGIGRDPVSCRQMSALVGLDHTSISKRIKRATAELLAILEGQPLPPIRPSIGRPVGGGAQLRLPV